MPPSVMDLSLEAALAQIRWPVPHHIPAINEDDDEPLLPLEGPLMDGLPHVQTVQELGLLTEGQSLPPQHQGPVQRLQPNLHSFSLPQHWPVYKEMTYFGVEEENQEEWDAQQTMEEAEDELEFEGIEEETTLTSNTSQEGPFDVSLSTKRRPPVVDHKQLLRDINSSAEPHIATIGLQEQPMPDATPPAFVPTLEQAHPQQ